MSFVPRRRSTLSPFATWCAPCVSALLLACSPLKPGDARPHASDAGARRSGCEHAEPPPPPSKVAASQADQELVFAAIDSDVGDSSEGPNGAPRYKSMGYDLDHTCTGQGQGSSCAKPDWETTAVPLDSPQGRDNSANAVFYQASLFVPPDQRVFSDFKADLDSGSQTVLVRIRGYNGQANDDRVEVAVFAGTLWESVLAGGPPPIWDGHDRWRVTTPWLERSADGSLSVDSARFRDQHAYVTNNTIVAHFDAVLLGHAFIPAGTWQQGLLTARIVHQGHAVVLRDAMLAGRWPARDLLHFLRLELLPGAATASCRDGAIYGTLVKEFCPYIDIASGKDGPSTPCDSISIFIGFDAEPAEIGDPIDVPEPAPIDCDPPAIDCSGTPL
jgi:hypothetical protein